MDTTRAIIRTDSESDRYVKVEDGNLTLHLSKHESVEFGVSNDYTVNENIDALIHLLTAIKGDLKDLK